MSPTQTNYQLSRDPLGRLVYTGNGETHVGIVPVRAFPIGQPDRGISLVSPDGHELVWIDQLTDLPENHRQLVEEELAGREFMPEIRRLKGVSAFVTPSTWTVETDRAPWTSSSRAKKTSAASAAPCCWCLTATAFTTSFGMCRSWIGRAGSCWIGFCNYLLIRNSLPPKVFLSNLIMS